MKKIYLFLLFSFFVSLSFAQNIYLEFTDGTQELFSLTDIRNISFAGDNMNLNMKNGTTESWNVFEIANYNYKGFSDTTATDTTVIDPSYIYENANFTNLKLYPNPISDVFIISFENTRDKDIQVEILDIDAKIVSTSKIEIKNGKSELNLSSEIKELPQGIYFCKLSSENKTSTHKIIKK